jgi:hypothetical protein
MEQVFFNVLRDLPGKCKHRIATGADCILARRVQAL